MNIYYLKDGQKERVYDPMMTYPKRFKIFDVQDHTYRMSLWLSYYLEDGYSTTYIEYPDGSMDTLKLKGEKAENGVMRGEILWYNGKLVSEEVSKFYSLSITKPVE